MSCFTRNALWYLAFAATGLLVYSPALTGTFLWDDTDWIVDNEALRTWGGLWRIWFEPGAVIQYYPLTYTTWWLDYQIWGLSEVALHIENVLLHAGNALLVGLLLRRLGLPGAWLAAVVFLLHPVHVESVAWIVERKNTLSMLFYLGSAYAWLRFLEGGRRSAFLAAAALFLCALLAKTATLMLPVTLLALTVWRVGWRDRRLLFLLPLGAMSLVAAAVTFVMERGEGAVGHDWALTWVERLPLTGQVMGFYLTKLLVPVQLAFVYGKWEIAPGTVTAWLPSAAIVLALVVGLRSRRRAVLACGLALLVFAANLLPVSGLVDFYYLRYAYVGDHFQYLASLGPIALLCCGGAWLLRGAPRGAGLAIAAVAVSALGYASWQRSAVFADVERLWRATLATEPDAWLAHTNLGNLLAARGGPDDGIEHHRRAVEIYPDAFESNNALGNYFVRREDFAAARQYFERALQARPEDPLTFNNLGISAGAEGDLRSASGWFEQGLARAPDNRELQRNLSLLLSSAPDPALRDGARALAMARALNRIPQPSVVDQLALFRGLLLVGERQQAIELGRELLARAEREEVSDVARQVRDQLERLER